MFGIGGGELIFILFVILMLFGSDKVPEIARTMGKAMAQLKNATNDIKSEIQKGADDNGFDHKTLGDFSNKIHSEVNNVSGGILGNVTETYGGISENFHSEINVTKNSILNENVNLTSNDVNQVVTTENDSFKGVLTADPDLETVIKTEEIETLGPIKRKK